MTAATSHRRSHAGAARSAGSHAGGRRMNRRIRLSFIGCVKSELLKLWSLNSTKWMLGIAVAINVAMAALSAWSVTFLATIDVSTGKTLDDPQPILASDMWSVLASSGSTAALVIGIFGVMVITSEYTTSAIQSSLAANPRRGMFYIAKSAAVALFTLVASAVGVALAWVVMTMMTSGYEAIALADNQRRIIPVVLIGFPVVMMLVSLMAQGLGGLTRSTVGGVCAVVGLFMILSSVASIVALMSSHIAWLGSVSYCLPDSALNNFLTAGVQDSTTAALTRNYWVPAWWQSGLILLAWTAAAWIAGFVVTRRADIK